MNKFKISDLNFVEIENGIYIQFKNDYIYLTGNTFKTIDEFINNFTINFLEYDSFINHIIKNKEWYKINKTYTYNMIYDKIKEC